MRNIKTALKISGSLILLSFILSISIIYYLKLDNPVFLKNYIDVNYYEYENMYTLSGLILSLNILQILKIKERLYQ